MLLVKQAQLALLKWQQEQELRRLRKQSQHDVAELRAKVEKEAAAYAKLLKRQRERELAQVTAIRAGGLTAAGDQNRKWKFGEYPIELARRKALLMFARRKAKAMRTLITVLTSGVQHSLRQLATMIGVQSPNTVRAYKLELSQMGLLSPA